MTKHGHARWEETRQRTRSRRRFYVGTTDVVVARWGVWQRKQWSRPYWKSRSSPVVKNQSELTAGTGLRGLGRKQLPLEPAQAGTDTQWKQKVVRCDRGRLWLRGCKESRLCGVSGYFSGYMHGLRAADAEIARICKSAYFFGRRSGVGPRKEEGGRRRYAGQQAHGSWYRWEREEKVAKSQGRKECRGCKSAKGQKCKSCKSQVAESQSRRVARWS